MFPQDYLSMQVFIYITLIFLLTNRCSKMSVVLSNKHTFLVKLHLLIVVRQKQTTFTWKLPMFAVLIDYHRTINNITCRIYFNHIVTHIQKAPKDIYKKKNGLDHLRLKTSKS